jgi:hypothetical protein
MKNNWLPFLSRLAFLCNVCSLFVIITHYTGNMIATWHNIIGTIVILGVVSILINVALQIILLVYRIKQKDIPIPHWVRIFNVAMFVAQILFYFIIPGQ